MVSLLLPIIYLAFISLGLPDGLLGAAWPSMYEGLGASVSGGGLISMIISAGTVVSALSCNALQRRLGTREDHGHQRGHDRPCAARLLAQPGVLAALPARHPVWAGRGAAWTPP